MERNKERGAFRPGWVAVAVVTCVLVGSTLNKCLFCSQNPSDAGRTFDVTQLQGERLDAPVAAASTAEPPVAESEDEEGVPDAIPVPKGPPIKSLKKAAAPVGLKGFEDLTFDAIANYAYEFEEQGSDVKPKPDQIPERIRKLDGKNISIKGFIIPLKNEGEEIVEFVLVRNQSFCCFGQVPRMNEWLHVTMEQGKSVPYDALDIPLTVFGKLSVGEVYENGLLMSIYRLKCVHVVEPPRYR